MDTKEIEIILEKTFADRKLSKSEKKALDKVVAEWDQQQIEYCRNYAFKMVRQGSRSPKKVIDWLEAVVKCLHKTDDGQQQPSSAHFSPGEDCLKRIQMLLRKARQAVDICVFTITDNRITEDILDCYERGINVRIITDDDKTEDLGSDIQRLVEAGIPVLFDRGPEHMHHKFAIFDNTILMTGSYNWTRSAATQYENIIVTREKKLLSRFSREFALLWDTLSK